MVEVVAFDGDDTLWHNESIFSMTQGRLRDLLAPYLPAAEVDDRLLAIEKRNLERFGYGVKGFTLSMIETAIEASGRQVTAEQIHTLIEHGKGMLDHPVELLDGAAEALTELPDRYEAILVTKGDLLDQESKIARSGLAERFSRTHVVSEKNEQTYRRLMAQAAVAPDEFLMVGNSLRSDVLPVVGLGAHAVHVPYHTTWAHERVAASRAPAEGYWEIEHLGQLPGVLARIEAP